MTTIDAGQAPGRRTIFLYFAGCEIMDIAGPLQAVHESLAFGGRYTISHCGVTSAVRTAQGLETSGLAPLPEPRPTDRVIVPGYALATSRPPAKMMNWLKHAHARGAEVCAVCTGAFALGEAGLLDGRRCTTHWRRMAELRARHPLARVVDERLFVEDDRIVTSAGIAAGIDMTLALLERDHGPVLASAVAREMVVYLRRDGAQAQESIYLDFQTHLHPGIHRVQQYLIANPVNGDSLSALARIAEMSERNLTRVFKRATGISIHAYRTRLRLERARALLRNPTLSVQGVATASGFGGARQFRRAWREYFGGSPGMGR